MTLAAVPLRERVTKARRRKYVLAIKRAQRQIGRLENNAIRAIRSDLADARIFLLRALDHATPFQQWHAANVLRAIDEALLKFRDQATRNLQGNLNQAWDLGVTRASTFARSLDVSVPRFQFGIPREQLEFAQNFSVDLIQHETDSIRHMVGVEIRQAAAGKLSRGQLVKRVMGRITTPLRFGTMKNRAEVIVRTELNRMHNAAAQAGREGLAADNVVVKKQWLASPDGPTTAGGRVRPAHWKLNGVVVPYDKPFPYPGIPKSRWPMYPLDPVLLAEEAVNCR
jgi:uncharacterized protein with gpF-like domain